MCKRPIKIRNVAYDPTDELSAEFVEIPCGHCDECADSRVSEILFRCDWQTSLLGEDGFCVFSTLTFNDAHLPVVEYSDEDGVIHSLSTWNNKLVRCWVVALQKCIHRTGWICKYIITCERGHSETYVDEKGNTRVGTSRPHYHCALWVYNPNHVDFKLTYHDVFRKSAMLWSGSPRKVTDVVDKSTKVPNSRFQANLDPIGYVYNELIGRNNATAMKYVIKYAIKDIDETAFTIQPYRIVSHNQKIDYTSMLPRVRYSNGIGLNFLSYVGCSTDVDGKIVVPDIEVVSARLESYVGKQSDGNITRVPRYYIKKLSQKVVTLVEDYVEDNFMTFDGENVVPKFAHDVPRETFYSDGREVFNYRLKKTTCTLRTAFGSLFRQRSIVRRGVELFRNLPDFLASSLPAMDSAPFFKEWGFLLQSKFYRLANGFSDLKDKLTQYLLPLSQEDFVHLWKNVIHFPWVANNTYYDRLSDEVPEETPDLLTWFSMQCLHQFADAFGLMSHYNSSLTKYSNHQNFVNPAKITQRVMDNPIPWIIHE